MLAALLGLPPASAQHAAASHRGSVSDFDLVALACARVLAPVTTLVSSEGLDSR
jgi:hypothetical protein